jgi:Zn-dependent protease
MIEGILGIIVLVAISTLYIVLNRKNFKFEGLKIKGVPIIYLAAHKTRFGLDFTERLAKKHQKVIKVIGYVCIVVAFLVMIAAIGSLALYVYQSFNTPELVAGKPAVMMILPVKASFALYVPLAYWLSVLFCVVVTHEFGHALLSGAYGLPVKNSGFAFFGIIFPIIPAAYVEPDIEELKKRRAIEKLSIFSAGAVFNIVLCLIGYGLFMLARAGSSFPPILEFLRWLVILNFGVGMTNLLPFGPLDGGRMIDAFGKKWLLVSANLLIMILLVVTIIQSSIL